MGFLNNELIKQLGQCALIGLARASGVVVLEEKNNRNTQCVKLTKGHTHLLNMVTYWCAERKALLKAVGISAERLLTMERHDAKLLDGLKEALAEQQKKQPEYDSWLFFNCNVLETDFFELQECEKGSFITKTSIIVQK